VHDDVIGTEVWSRIRSLEAAVCVPDPPQGVEDIDPGTLHRGLNAFNRARLVPSTPSSHWATELSTMRAAEEIEARFVEEERARTRQQVACVPHVAHEFVEWFVALRDTGPGQYDPFFDFLAEEATRREMRYFIQQEYCGEIGFDDLIALTQVRLPTRAKVELARNFWDEHGRGNLDDVHGLLYEAMVHELGVGETPDTALLWETLAVANLLTALACNRRYTWQSLGALSVIELTSPTRAVRIARGLERLALSDLGCRYFRLHSVIDVDHWNAWLAEVIVPLVTASPALAVPLAEGALLRLNAGARLIGRYRSELDLDADGARLARASREHCMPPTKVPMTDDDGRRD